VAGKNKLPGNWADFLRDSTNKQKLFAFLSRKVKDMICPANKEIVIICGSTTTAKGSNRSVAPCNHEEADNRLSSLA